MKAAVIALSGCVLLGGAFWMLSPRDVGHDPPPSLSPATVQAVTERPTTVTTRTSIDSSSSFSATRPSRIAGTPSPFALATDDVAASLASGDRSTTETARWTEVDASGRVDASESDTAPIVVMGLSETAPAVTDPFPPATSSRDVHDRSSGRPATTPTPAAPGTVEAPSDATRERAAGALAGVVVTSEGLPVSGLLVVAERAFEGEPLILAVDTDEQGRFFLFGPTPPGEYLVRTEQTLLYAPRTLRLRSGGETVRIVVARQDSLVLGGTVIDEHGAPIPDATVTPPLADERVRTDEDGAFSLLATTVEERGLLLRYEAAGYLPESRYLAFEEWASEEAVDAGVALRRGFFTLSGHVVDEGGAPLEHALVQIESEELRSHQSAQSDASGYFAISDVLAADDYDVRVLTEAYFLPHLSGPLSIGADSADLDVTLRAAPLGRLDAVVLGPSGVPLPNLSFTVLNDGAGGRATSVVTDEQGAFVLEDFVAGELSFRSRSAPGIVIEGVAIDSGEERSLALIVDVGEHAVEGLVRDPRGFPVADARLVMRWYRDDGEVRSTVQRSTVSDGEGKFRFSGLGTDPRRLRIAAAGLSSTSLEIDPTLEPGPVMITLAR